IVLFVLPRVVWRIVNGWPKAAGNYTKMEHLSGKIVHWVLIVATVAMPLSGIVMAVAGGHGLGVFGIEFVPENIDPTNPEEVIVLSALLTEIGESIHELGADVLPIAIGLHIVGALKHHLVDRDETLRRMLGKAPR
ncbi:MAG: cytochrome b, partial [Pseudomonadales bacterium]